MTDAAFPVKAINAHDLSHASHAASHLSSHQRFAASETSDVPADDGQISCICGYADDDGWTVACDLCNRWQHQSCYYPHYDELSLPDDLQHYCVDCSPRPVDVSTARARQRQKREHAEPLTNGAKRAVSKSHKKKVKELVPYTNGWSAADKIRHDRNSASPRDQPPPAKRPKTSHRASDSTATTTTTKGHSRKRNASTVNQRRSVSRSPDASIDQYSEEFLQCYSEDSWRVTDANVFNNIAIGSALPAWLAAHEDEFRAMHKQPKGEVLMRWDSQLEDIPGKAMIHIQDAHDDTVRYGGQHPSWKMVTVEEPVPSGGYIGELKGVIAFKKEYQQDASNRWPQLRHPEPFVFFHPSLPIIIDARNEGTALRYVRRSCQPNARLQILVTGGHDYHFCFMATSQIEPGVEVAVSWDTSEGLPELNERSTLSDEHMELLSAWVSTALANCGPCACGLPEGSCKMSRFDRRNRNNEDEAPTTRMPKSKKRKGPQVSPLNTAALNSRSGSEARKVEADDDGTDSRSASGSAGRDSASRDITPNTHYSANGTQPVIPEISERERKKMAKEEEIFRRQEEERTGKQAKKKRNSAGSSLNTPSATTSKQLGLPPTTTSSRHPDSGTPKQASLPPAKSTMGRKPKTQKAPMRPSGRIAKRPKPVYVDSETQCDMDQEEATQRAPTPSSRRPYVSTRQRLLERCARNNASSCAALSTSPVKTSVDEADQMDTEKPIVQPVESMSSPAAPSSPLPEAVALDASKVEVDQDAEMEDAPQEGTKAEALAEEQPSPEPPNLEDSPSTSKQSPPVLPPVPPLRPVIKSTEPEAGEESSKQPDLHIAMPPPPSNPFSQPILANGPAAQSPGSFTTGPMFSPAVTAAVSPSPARKKLSLSDYTRRSKAKDKEPDGKADRESSPASTASGGAAVVPVVQPSSSGEAAAAEGGSAIDDDVKMEDADATPAVLPSIS